MHTVLLLLSLASAGLVLFAMPEGSCVETPAGPPGPPEALDRLQAYLGTWDAEVSMMGQTAKGVETCRMGVGGMWLLTDFEGELMGAPFLGHGLTGFDAATERFHGVWVDSTSGSIARLANGRFEDGGKSLLFDAEGVDMMGNPAKSRHVTRFPNAKTRVFEVYQADERGAESLVMSIKYQKR